MAQYRYPHFKREIMMEGLSFHGGVSPGQPMPDFELTTTDGQTIRKSDFVGERPMFMTFASITCPMVVAAAKTLEELHREFGDRVEFVTLYVREAHPGDYFPQPDTLDQKLAFARAYKQRDDIDWPVAVDDVEGTLHRKLDPVPNAAYIMAPDGTVAYRSLSSNGKHVLKKGLRAIAEGQKVVGEIESHLVPMLSGLGELYSSLESAGPTAKRDVAKEIPPIFALARIASLFRPLSPLGRGVAALGVSGLGIFALAKAIKSLRGSRGD